MAGPLEHLRVIDCTDIRGALAARILGDLGADVVKVEAPGGDVGRMRGPFAGDAADPGRALAFLYRNANKRGCVLDHARASDVDAFHGLCAAADVLVDNAGPSRPPALDFATISERHPHLVHVAIADFGLSGPRVAWRLEALPAFAASGALFASGFADRPPCWLPVTGVAGHR